MSVKSKKHKPKYERLILKLSGEMLGGDQGFGLDPLSFSFFADEIGKVVHKFKSVRIGVVVGGGNILRGARNELPIDRVAADYLGMLATVINGVSLKAMLEAKGLRARVLSAAQALGTIPYSPEKARDFWKSGDILILTGGTGNPYFTTDTTAALRAAELGANVLVKGTKVEGVYSSDPESDPDAEFLPDLTYEDALIKELKIMDMTAFALCMEQKIPILIYNAHKEGALLDIVAGKKVGSLIHSST